MILDVVVARITTQGHASLFDFAIRGWCPAGLLAESVVRVHKLATLEKAIVVRVLGKLEEPDLKQVEERLARRQAASNRRPAPQDPKSASAFPTKSET